MDVRRRDVRFMGESSRTDTTVTKDAGPIDAPGVPGFRHILPTLIFDAALPVIAFNVLIAAGVSTLWALAAGAIFPALNNLRLLIKSRRLEPVGIIVISFLTVGTGASLISG